MRSWEAGTECLSAPPEGTVDDRWSRSAATPGLLCTPGVWRWLRACRAGSRPRPRRPAAAQGHCRSDRAGAGTEAPGPPGTETEWCDGRADDRRSRGGAALVVRVLVASQLVVVQAGRLIPKGKLVPGALSDGRRPGASRLRTWVRAGSDLDDRRLLDGGRGTNTLHAHTHQSRTISLTHHSQDVAQRGEGGRERSSRRRSRPRARRTGD